MPRLSVRRPANGRAPRALWWVSLAAAGLLSVPSPGRAQVTIFNGNSFDSPAYTSGQLASFYQFGATGGQQGWLTTDPRQNPFLPQPPVAGVVQSGTTFAGGQAFQIVGNRMIDDTGFSGQGFWFRNYPTFAGSFNPTANGTPLVHMSVMEYVSGTPPVTTADMPFVGVYMEGYTATGQQQQIGAVLLNINNGVTGFTIGGQSLATADNFYTRNAWHDLEVDFNFTTQTYSATLDGAPVVFTNGTSNFTSLPFRNTNGPTVSLAEYGFQASFNESSGTTANNAFFDNFMLTALNPVPEPSSLLLLGAGAAGVAFPGLRRWRKGGAAKA